MTLPTPLTVIPSNESVAWFYMGEGCATILIARRKPKRTNLDQILGYRIYPRVIFTNNDPALIEAIEAWLIVHDILYLKNTQTYKNKKHTPSIHLRINKYAEIKKFLELLLPHLKGWKLEASEILLEYVTKYGGRSNWSALMREKMIHDKVTGKIIGIDWDKEEERMRFLDMMTFRDRILKINGGHRAKYNRQFFLDLWEMEG